MAVPEEKWWDAGTVAVVTGSNKGIGYAIAQRLAGAGMTVVMTARSGAGSGAGLAACGARVPAVQRAGSRVLLVAQQAAAAHQGPRAVPCRGAWDEGAAGGESPAR
jgi:NAD(P)-dependent dehydrogenase (short-subunit alcohol dehydrogenase family)